MSRTPRVSDNYHRRIFMWCLRVLPSFPSMLFPWVMYINRYCSNVESAWLKDKEWDASWACGFPVPRLLSSLSHLLFLPGFKFLLVPCMVQFILQLLFLRFCSQGREELGRWIFTFQVFWSNPISKAPCLQTLSFLTKYLIL